MNADSWPQGPGRWARWAAAAIAWAAIAAAVPALPAVWASIVAPGGVTNKAGMGGGTLTVTGCSRSFLLVDWHCRGAFDWADPMASDPMGKGATIANVVLANDPRHYDPGAHVDASLRVGSHSAYLWGDSYFTSNVLLPLPGFALCALAAGLLLLRRQYVDLEPTGLILGTGLLCLSPTLVGLWPAAVSALWPW